MFPNWPDVPTPHAYTFPSFESAYVVFAPDFIAVIPVKFPILSVFITFTGNCFVTFVPSPSCPDVPRPILYISPSDVKIFVVYLYQQKQ